MIKGLSKKEYYRQYRKKNRKKILAQKKKYYKDNIQSDSYKNKKRNESYIRKYGITLETYNELFNKQKGCCAICNKHQSELKKVLVVDHCHTTGNVRELLCSECNIGIGLLKDSPSTLNAAYEYLMKWDKRHGKTT